MDYHTFSWGDGDRLLATFATAVADRFDVAMLVLDFPTGPVPEAWWTACEAFAEACGKATGLVVSSLPETMPEAAQARIRSLGLVPMIGIAETIRALGALGIERSAADMAAHRPAPALPDRPGALDEAAGKALLATVGIEVPRGTVTTTPIPSPVPYPVTLKVLGIEHKADVGAVAVGVRDEAELRQVLAGMPDGAGFLVEETVAGGHVELLISLRADRLGWLLTIGAGGGLVELLDDRVHLLVPADAGAVRQAVKGLRVCRAARAAGREPAITAAVDAIMGLQTMCEDPRVVEAEINPLIVTADRAVAVDALVSVL